MCYCGCKYEKASGECRIEGYYCPFEHEEAEDKKENEDE